MSEMHSIGATEESRKLAEVAGPAFVREGLLQARKKSWEILAEIRKRMREGLTERQAYHLALEVFHGFGVDKHWHKPYVRFGPGTALSFNESLQPDYQLQENDPYYLDLGPVFRDPISGIEYEGDVGDSFVFGENAEAERRNAHARDLFQAATELWRRDGASGKTLYEFLERKATALGLHLKPYVHGHRLSDYPHNKYSKERLARVEFCPSPTFWVLEVQVVEPNGSAGAFFEDLLLPVTGLEHD